MAIPGASVITVRSFLAAPKAFIAAGLAFLAAPQASAVTGLVSRVGPWLSPRDPISMYRSGLFSHPARRAEI